MNYQGQVTTGGSHSSEEHLHSDSFYALLPFIVSLCLTPTQTILKKDTGLGNHEAYRYTHAYAEFPTTAPVRRTLGSGTVHCFCISPKLVL